MFPRTWAHDFLNGKYSPPTKTASVVGCATKCTPLIFHIKPPSLNCAVFSETSFDLSCLLPSRCSWEEQRREGEVRRKHRSALLLTLDYLSCRLVSFYAVEKESLLFFSKKGLLNIIIKSFYQWTEHQEGNSKIFVGPTDLKFKILFSFTELLQQSCNHERESQTETTVPLICLGC